MTQQDLGSQSEAYGHDTEPPKPISLSLGTLASLMYLTQNYAFFPGFLWSFI